MSTPLNRANVSAAAAEGNGPDAPATGTPAPVRLIHLGLGAFHRAHQVWYTQHAEADPAHPEWG